MYKLHNGIESVTMNYVYKCHRQATAFLFINKDDRDLILPKGTFLYICYIYQGPITQTALLDSLTQCGSFNIQVTE